MKKLIALLIALILGLFSTTVSTADIVTVDRPTETKILEWTVGYFKRCRAYRGKVQKYNHSKDIKRFARRVALAPLSLLIGTASAEGTIIDNMEMLNDGNPMPLGKQEEGHLFTVSPTTAKKARGYFTKVKILLTKFERKMPGVVVGQNRGMLKSSNQKIAGNYVVPDVNNVNLIIVDEKSNKLSPVDDEENKIWWKGNGKHQIKNVVGDGVGMHWFCDQDGRLAFGLWFKVARFLYGCKGMLMPGLATDIGCKIIDHWGVERTITKGNTLLMNSSMIKGLGAYDSLEELIEHANMWGLTVMQKQWQSGDHVVERRRKMGTQPNSTNLEQTEEEITELLKPEARKIFGMKFEKTAWMKMANIHTSRGRALAARPRLIYKDLIVDQINSTAGNAFLRNAQGKFMAKGQYLKMYVDKLVYSYVYVYGMDVNEAAKKAAETGLHGEIRVSPYFAGRHIVKDEETGKTHYEYTEETFVDSKGRYIVTALVRYPHGAPSETIIVKAYIDPTVPNDVIVFPAPVADEEGRIPVKYLYALRLQGADFDGDAVTAFIEKIWLEAQKRNIGKSYMIIPINTESTEKDTTLVTDETFESFFQMKVESLSNRVGLIATSLKYFFSQFAPALKSGCNPERDAKVIGDHACAMGDDIDEYKHGKANNDLVPFVVTCPDKKVYLSSPFFNRFAKKYRSKEEFDKAVYDKNGNEKQPGQGILDTYAKIFCKLMKLCKIDVKPVVRKASDGKDRYYYTVEPATWQTKDVDLFGDDKGEAQKLASLPPQLEELYGVEHGTLFSAKTLFQMIYKDHVATIKGLLASVDSEEDRDELVKVADKINERYLLATATVVAWTKAMKLAKSDEELSTVDALKLFTKLMIQHTPKTRGTIDTMTTVGVVEYADGTTYEKTSFSAKRMYNYFLDVCGDGLFLSKTETPDFPEVSQKTIDAVGVSMPDMEEAEKLAMKRMKLVEKIVNAVPFGTDTVKECLEEYEDASVLNDGCEGWYGEDEDNDFDLDNLCPEDLNF